MDTKIDPTLTGEAFNLANAGYEPMSDPKKDDQEAIGGDHAALREAAGKRAADPDPVTVRRYSDAEGRLAPANESVVADSEPAVEESAEDPLSSRLDPEPARALEHPQDLRH